MDRRFATIIAVIVIVFIGAIAFSKNSNQQNGSSGTSGSGQPTNHIFGEGQKHVTLVEYGDYECPVCSVYYQPLKELADKYKTDIHFQFRNLPLTSLHKNAFAAARAAEAASLQGKFWEMHDKIYENQDPTGASGWVVSNDPLSYFTGYANQIGLNIDQFKKDYASNKVNNAINADLAAFNKTGQAMATPTFFLDGSYLPNDKFVDAKTGRPTVEKMSAVIDAEIAKKNPSNQQ